MANKKKSGLGRGLGSLMGDAPESGSPLPSLELPQAAAPEKAQPTTEAAEPVQPAQELQAPAEPTHTAKEEVSGSDYVRTEAEAEAAENAPVNTREARTESAAPSSTTTVPSAEARGDQVKIKSIVNRDAKIEGEVPISKVMPNPDQPRTHFKKEEIDELAASIDKEGLLQPILVRKVGEGYQIIAGERRWQACKQLGKKNIPVSIIDATDDKAIELALVENIQRSDLNPIEEAYGYKRLMERCGMTQSDVAQAVSKGRSTVANALRLLDLPEDAQQLLYEEKIAAGHARAILSVPTKDGRQRLTDKLKNEKLSVRETEAIARLMVGQSKAKGRSSASSTPGYFKPAARALREKLQTNVRIRSVQGKNKVEIEFSDEEELNRIFGQLMGE